MSAKVTKGIFILAIVLGVNSPLIAQWSDDFSDNEFTSNPAWVGNTSEFIIETETLRLNAPPETGSSYLTTNSDISLEASWNFYIKLDFNPSSSNYVKVYLMADSINIGNSKNGYFVKIGGSNDEVSLYKVEGGDETTLIDGVDDRVNLGIVEINIIVTRAANGDWELSSKLVSETDYVSEGTATDLSIQQSSYFGIFCKYTSTRSTKFYVDDISVIGNPYIDLDPPLVLSTYTLENKQIGIVFSEPMDTVGTKNSEHYVLNNSIAPKQVEINSLDSMVLVFDTELALINTLSIEDVPDLAGNLIDTLVQVVFVDPSPFDFRDLVLNELFPDPNPQEDLPAFEFVEMFNNSGRIINVEGWQFTDGAKIATLESGLIYPDSFLIICATEAQTEYANFGETMGLANWPSLNNGGDPLQLIDSTGQVIDSLTYSLDWYNDVDKNNGGWTLEQINPNASCNGSCNWAASIEPGGGTPGERNSVFDLGLDEEPPLLLASSTPRINQIELVFDEALDTLKAKNTELYMLNDSISPLSTAIISEDTILLSFQLAIEMINTLEIISLTDIAGNKLDTLIDVYFVDPDPHSYREIVINELFPDPSPQEDLPLFEFVELHNISEKIINLKGWHYTDGTSLSIFSNHLIYPDSFLIICPVEASDAYSQLGAILEVEIWPTLNNGSDSLVLLDNTGAVIDALGYSNDWYKDNTKDDGGWTLEQINPIANGSSENWVASIDPSGGTPGRINSVYDLGLDKEAPFVVEASTPSITQIMLVFNEAIDTIKAKETEHYLMNASISPVKVFSIGMDSILLEFSTKLDLTNNLNLINLTDTVGNAMDTLLHIFYINPAPYNYRNVVINEIFPDPQPQEELPPFEFAELLNTSDRIVNLKDWVYGDGSNLVSLPQFLLFPDSLLIICSEEAVEQYRPYGSVLGLTNWPLLNNGGDSLRLMSKTGMIDSVFYEPSWYRDNIKDDGGWSLEQINSTSKCMGSFNWKASKAIAGGTPGKTNSLFSVTSDLEPPSITQALVTDSLVEVWFSEFVAPNNYTGVILPDGMSTIFEIDVASHYGSGHISSPIIGTNAYSIEIPLEDCNGNYGVSFSELIPIKRANNGDIVINEILFNPYSGGADFVELANTTSNYYNLTNYMITNVESNSIISDTTLLLAPRHFLAISEDIVFLKNQYLAPDSSLVESDLPSFPDDESAVVLKSNLGETLDSIFYSDDIHFSLISDTEGISLERISTFESSTNNDNWRSAAEAVGFASPGYENSQSRVASTEGSVVISPEIITPNNDGQADFCQISYGLDQQAQTMSISIYNINGQLVKTIASNTLIPPSGFFTWDGTDQQGGVLPTAHYIIVSEVLTSDGRVVKFRDKVVVANGF